MYVTHTQKRGKASSRIVEQGVVVPYFDGLLANLDQET
jgi:hypothetical protein